jgi:hypothetical protein
MRKRELLQGLHQVLQPRTYFEIGVRRGASLRLSRAPAVAVDPAYEVTSQVRCDLHLVRTTSDEFFARPHPLAHFDRPFIDLAFIDGMHLAEFALRDFMNTERFCHAGSVVVLDDVLPRNEVEAGRNSTAVGAWAGDVYKVVDTLRALRPDLITLEVDTTPTGTLMVLLPDPGSHTLDGAYDRLVQEYVTPDPQKVPEWATTRSRALPAERLLGSPVWAEVRRRRRLPDLAARPAIRSAYEHAGLSTPTGAS